MADTELIDATTARLDMRNVSKSFGMVHALDDVSLSIRPGEIVAIVGENGAGKSTLMKIVAGVEHADSGEVEFEGSSIDRIDESQATSLGIAMVHQERSLVPHLSVAENVFAGHPPARLGLIDTKAMRAGTMGILDRLRVDVAPEALVGSISPAEQQMVEIAKALSHDLKLLVLDEPTAALTISETNRLFEIVRGLRDRGVAILYISHRLAEVFALADSILVLRDGSVTARRPTGSVTESELMALMVGRELSLARVDTDDRDLGDVRLSVRHLAALPRVIDVDVDVRTGEIVCLAGLIGAGRTEACETIFGLRRTTSGIIEIDGRERTIRSPQEAMALGIGMIPEDRREDGLFLDETIALNVAATNLTLVSPGGWLSWSRVRALARQYAERLSIRTPSVEQLVGLLSGGNQQKVLLAKWVARNPRVLIIDEPTRGVDVGARAEIYAVIRELAAGGTAILVVSSDLTEVLGLSDRIVVMAEGRTTGVLDGRDATELAVLELAAPVTTRREYA